MKRIIFILPALLVIFQTMGYSQYYYLYGDKAFGGNRFENAGQILSYKDNSILLTGVSVSGISGNKTVPLCDTVSVDLWNLKIDTAFNILWQQNIGGNRADRYPFISFNTDSSKIIFSCNSESDSSCSKSENNRSYPLFNEDYWIGVLDTSGNMIWDKTLGGTDREVGSKTYSLSNGQLVSIGSSLSPVGADKSVTNYGQRDFWVVKTDSLGNKIWDNVYGGTNNEIDTDGIGTSLVSLPNGEFLFGGRTNSPNDGTISDTSRGLYDIWIAKIDSSGNQIWDKRYGGSVGEALYDIKKTNDNGFILCGITWSSISGEVSDSSRGQYDIWVVKIDSIGNKLWDKRFGGALGETGKSIQQDFDGGYWIGGDVRSGAGLDVSEPNYGPVDYWIIKIDSIGNKIWDKRFGGPGNNYFEGFSLLADSSIMLFGHSEDGVSAVKTDGGYGFGDYWLVHFKYGNSFTGIRDIYSGDNLYTIFPNPTAGEITISPKGVFKPEEFYLFDTTGRQVLFKELDEPTIDISILQPALYFYEIHSRDGTKVYGKLLKQ